MKHLIKPALFGTGVLLILITLSGCFSQSAATLVVTATPSGGHPPFITMIKAVASKEGGTYTLMEDGQQPVTSSDGAFAVNVTTWPYKGSIVWENGTTVVESAVKLTLINKGPFAHDLALFPGAPEKGQGEIIDLRYLEQGCHNGTPMSYSGIEDPDYTASGYSMQNDKFAYHVEVYDKNTGKQETIYKMDRSVLGRDEYTTSPYFKWFVGWSGTKPPFPFPPQSLLSECDPIPIPPVPIEHGHDKVVNVYVKEFGNTYHWVYTIATIGASCSTP